MTTTKQRATTSAIVPPPGYWQREASHYPRPMTPLGASCLIEGINSAFRKVFEEFGFPLEALEFREIGGYVYQRMKPLGAGDGAGPSKLPPKFVLWSVLRVHPAFRKRAARCKASLRSRLDRQIVERWYAELRPQLTKDIERLRAVDLASLSDEQLAEHMDHVWRFSQDGLDTHFLLTLTWFPLINLMFFCRDKLGYSDVEVLPLFAGLSEMSSEPARALAQLAGRIRANEELRAAIANARPEAVGAVLAEHSSELSAAFEDYMYRYGCRALRYELVEQCLNERPELVGQLLQDELRKPAGVQEEQQRLAATRAEARDRAVAALPTEELRTEFSSMLEDAQRAYPIREENEFYTVSVPLALSRFAALEAARRLTAKSALASADDVFFLTYLDVVAALRGRTPARGVIEQRRNDFYAADAFDPPASYGTEPPIPPLDVFPAETRTAMEVLMYATEKVFEPEQSNRRGEAGGRELKGIAAGRGSYTGPARVIMGEEQFDRLQPGDVLVCPITSPVWSILFAKVGALVTDTGGILSHPAIIAREYGIPAVVATGNATEIIPDGAKVIVNGDSGVVQIVG
jgi:phosphohistidine swiveling domain-containing protein